MSNNGLSPFNKPVEELESKDPAQVSLDAGVEWIDSGDGTGVLLVPVLNDEIRIGHPDISIEAPEMLHRFTIKLLTIMYLAGADGNYAPSNEWVAYRDVPEGRFYEPVVMRSAEDPLARLFGADLDAFEESALKLGGAKQEFGDRSYSFALFPKVLYCIIIWKGDDEFPARARILLDSSSHHHLGAFELRMGAEELFRLLEKVSVGEESNKNDKV
ncbi:MAG: DUF3786 domain-containing protein [Actinobacteria bacterium]|nr:DUF3786 domain-containing protein [Actinomycetota bacterium]